MVSLFLPGTCRQRDGHLLSPALSSTSWKRGRRTRPRYLIQWQWGQGGGSPVVLLHAKHIRNSEKSITRQELFHFFIAVNQAVARLKNIHARDFVNASMANGGQISPARPRGDCLALDRLAAP